jgi:hypothetical protein
MKSRTTSSAFDGSTTALSLVQKSRISPIPNGTHPLTIYDHACKREPGHAKKAALRASGPSNSPHAPAADRHQMPFLGVLAWRGPSG